MVFGPSLFFLALFLSMIVLPSRWEVPPGSAAKAIEA
jgi:hypothetical protein